GFSATLDSEKDMARAVARMTYAFAEATVPKVNVIIGNAYGSAYIAMNSKSIGADMVYAWENAKIGMMD
ncbi:carboxyl transferase, partial [Extibacter muris]